MAENTWDTPAGEMIARLEELGVEVWVFRPNGECYRPRYAFFPAEDTEYRLRYAFLEAVDPTLDIAVTKFIEKLLTYVPVEKA
jgi:hypothetical protein